MKGFSTCRGVTGILSDLLDGEMGFTDRLRIRWHLLRCPMCRDYFGQFKQIYRATGEVDPAQLPDDFEEVMGRVVARWTSTAPDEPEA